MGKLLLKGDLENQSKGQFFLFGHWVDIIRFQREINQEFINLARTYFQESFLGRIWKGDILIADLEEVEKGRIRNLSSQNQRERSIDIIKRRRFHIPSCRYINIVRKRLRISRTHSIRREQLVGSEDLSGEFQDEPRELQPTETKDDAEARKDFWSIQGDFIYRQLCVSKEETFPIPLTYTHVTRAPNKNLDVLKE